MIKKTLLVILSLVVIQGCGRYGRPIPPEELAPRAIESLTITPAVDALTFSWSSPRRDLRGKELKQIDGYRIYRREIHSQKDIGDDSLSYDLIATVEDSHLKVRDELREKARAQGKNARRIEAPEALQQFLYKDTTLTPSTSYLYEIIPFNQGEVKGELKKRILVQWTPPTPIIQQLSLEEEGADLATFEVF